MGGREAILIVALTAAACTSHSPTEREAEREYAGDYLLSPDEAPLPVPEGVDVWIDKTGIELEVEGERTRVFDFGPEPPPRNTTGDPKLREILRAERDRQPEERPVLIIHVDPATPTKFLGHTLYMTSGTGWWDEAFVVETAAGPRAVYATEVLHRPAGGPLLDSSLHIEVSDRGTTASWHAPDTGAAQWWTAPAALGKSACARHPSHPEVRAALRERIAEGCAGINPNVSFDRSLTFGRELPSSLVIQALAAVAQSCNDGSLPWLMSFTPDPLTAACEDGWTGETRDFAWFRDEALRRASSGPPLNEL